MIAGPQDARSRPESAGPLVLFDGVCNLCHRTVRFINGRDPGRRFRFTSLQSDLDKQLAAEHRVESLALESMLLLEDGRLYRKSTAALRIARRLRFPWPLGYVFMLVPAAVRDAGYDFIGRRRYRWFGRRDYCLVSEPGAEDRFLD